MKIVGSGIISVDNIFVVKNNAVFGENSENEGVSQAKLPCRYIGSNGGGSASNTLCILSKLGFQSAILGVTGRDRGAKLVSNEFRQFGVSTDLVIEKEDCETRQFTHIISPNGHTFNSVCPVCGSRFPRAPTLLDRDVFSENRTLSRIYDSDILHVDRANRINLRLVDEAYNQGKIISFDFGYQPWMGNYEIASEIIRRATILKTSNAAARTFLSRLNKSSFHEMNPNLLICVTTLGDRGAQIAYKSEKGLKVMSLGPYQPRPVIDRGGAGDAFQAGLLYGLGDTILHERLSIQSESGLHNAMKLAQGFGALACTDYGARGYFLKKLSESNFESAIRKDFETLSRNEFVGTPEDADSLFAEKRNQLLSNDVCGVCGRRFLAADATTYYEERIDSASWAMSNSYLSGARSGKLLSHNVGRRVYFVGSGASFSVALLGALLLNQLTDNIGVAITPYEYASLSRADSSVVLISFGGENSDVLSALAKAKDLGSSEIHVITGKSESTLARAAVTAGGQIHHVSSRVIDAGFVSTVGMLSCMSMLVGVLAESLQTNTETISEFFSLQNLTETFQRAKKEVAAGFAEVSDALDREEQMHLVVLGSGWSWPAVVDFEARMTEGAVCTTEISELKNYTHGRYLNAYRNKSSRAFIIFGLPSDAKLTRFLKEKLSKDFPVLPVNTQLDPPLGALDLFIRDLYVSSEVSKKLGLDIAKAINFPKESRGLFSWGPIYSPTLKIDEFVKTTGRQTSRSKNQTKLS
jgi:sugar/nucleoside kinase (ribokinase family)